MIITIRVGWTTIEKNIATLHSKEVEIIENAVEEDLKRLRKKYQKTIREGKFESYTVNVGK